MPMDSHGYGFHSPTLGDQAPDFMSQSNDDDETMRATDISQNESHLSFVTPSAKYLPSTSNGRSMKDIEEQLTQLKKENFNLKLRIYFAEERKRILQGVENTDELVEKIMKLQVDHQNLKTELSDKEDLIVQAAKAMETLEKGHANKMNEMKRLHELTTKQFENKIEQLELDATYSKLKIDQAMSNSSNEGLVKNYESQIQHLELSVQESRQVIHNLEQELIHSRQEVSLLNNKVIDLENEVSNRNSKLKEVISDVKKVDQERKMCLDEVKSLKNELTRLEFDLHNKTEEIQRSKQGLCDKKHSEEELITIRKQMNHQSNTLEELTCVNKELYARIDELERSLRKEQRNCEEFNKQLNEEKSTCEQLKEQNNELRNDYESLKEIINKNKNVCTSNRSSRRNNNTSRSPSPSSASQYYINIKSTSSANAEEIIEKYEQLKHKHTNLFETFNETNKKLDKIDGEYQKSLNVIRNMLKEHKKDKYIISNYEDKLRTLENNIEQQHQNVDHVRNVRGQPEGSNEAREEFTEKDIVLLEKDVIIQDYIKQISELNSKLDKYETTSLENNEMTFMALQLKNKTEEIERLNTDIKKRTFNLQELVNTELWQKNKEIEKCMKKAEKKQLELNNLKQIVKERENHLVYIQREINEVYSEIKGNDETNENNVVNNDLLGKLQTLKDNMDCVSSGNGLLNELEDTKITLNICEKQRREALQACFVLNKRLEELADFLDSLINTSDLINTNTKKKLKHAVDTSRELSKTFNMTFNFTHSENILELEKNVPILPDYSQINFLSESDELADVTLEADSNNLEQCKDTVIQKLKTQLHNLRYQVKQKDIEIAKNQLSIENELSACEAFSEPDLVVSKARMGGVCVVSWPSSDSEESDDDDTTRLNKFKGKRQIRLEKSFEYKTLQDSYEKICKANKELAKEKELLEKKIALAQQVNECISTQQQSNKGDGDCNSTSNYLFEELKDQREHNRRILNKLEHLESIYTLITNKDDLVKELELYNEAKQKVSALQIEVNNVNTKNIELTNQLRETQEKINKCEAVNTDMKNDLLEKDKVNAKKYNELFESRQILIESEQKLRKELEVNRSYCTQIESELEISKTELNKLNEQLNLNKQYNEVQIIALTESVKIKNDELLEKENEIIKLKTQVDDLQDQLLNVSSSLDELKNNDEMKVQYEHTKQMLDNTIESLDTLKNEYENMKKDLNSTNNNLNQIQNEYQTTKIELEKRTKTNTELTMQYEVTKLELKNTNDNLSDMKTHYSTLNDQLKVSTEHVEELKNKLKSAKSNLENSINKIDVLNSDLNNAHHDRTELKLKLNDEINNNKLIKEDNNQLVNKINDMEKSRKTWEKEMNLLKVQIKKYRENEEKDLDRHTELVNEMTKRIDDFKNEKIQLCFEIKDLRRKIEDIMKDKEEMLKKFGEKEEKLLKQSDRTLQEVHNEMKKKLENANDKVIQKDDKINQIEDLYKAREKELRLKYTKRENELKRQLDSLTLNNSEIILERARIANEKLKLQQELREKNTNNPINIQVLERMKSELEKRVNELEVSNIELEQRLASFHSSDLMLSAGEDSPRRRSLCTPPSSPSGNLNILFSMSRQDSSNDDGYFDRKENSLPVQFLKPLSSISSPSKFTNLINPFVRDNNSSPDLGIDSDHGRISNSEASDNADKSNVTRLIEENEQLQKMLNKTRYALESTIKQLAAANRRKCQIERDICKQLHKTQHIIRKARVNIQSTEQPPIEGEEDKENDENADPLAT